VIPSTQRPALRKRIPAKWAFFIVLAIAVTAALALMNR